MNTVLASLVSVGVHIRLLMKPTTDKKQNSLVTHTKVFKQISEPSDLLDRSVSCLIYFSLEQSSILENNKPFL